MHFPDCAQRAFASLSPFFTGTRPMSDTSQDPAPRGPTPEAREEPSRRDFLQQAAAGGLAAAGVAGLAPSPADAEPARGEPSGKVTVTLHINGRRHELALD